jgi:hypothetical protein
MTTSSERLEYEAEQSRERFTAKLEELRAQITPGQLVDQFADYARESGGGEFVRNLGRQVRDNPLPVALQRSDFAEAPPSADMVELDVALGDPQEQIDPVQYGRAKPWAAPSLPALRPAVPAAPASARAAAPPSAGPPRLPSAPARSAAELPVRLALAVREHAPQPVQALSLASARARARGNRDRRVRARSRWPRRQHENRAELGVSDPRQGDLGSDRARSALPRPPDGAGGEDLFLQVPIAYGLR